MPVEFNYMILESLDNIRNKLNIKTIHLIYLRDDKITFGRNIENDIIDNDISVSRFHSVFLYNNEEGTVTIKNKTKKFGTLVLIKNRFKILEKEINVQVGRSFITIRSIKEYNNKYKYSFY